MIKRLWENLISKLAARFFEELTYEDVIKICV